MTVEGIAGAVRHGIAIEFDCSRRQGADLRGAYIQYTGNLYGDLIKVTFKKKLREEQAFDSIDALKTQINQDIEQARHYFDE